MSIPEVTVEGPPPDIARDPQKLMLYESFRDGVLDAEAGKAPPPALPAWVDDGSGARKAYEAGYEAGMGNREAPYDGPTIGPDLGGERYPDDVTPRERALLEFIDREYLGFDEEAPNPRYIPPPEPPAE